MQKRGRCAYSHTGKRVPERGERGLIGAFPFLFYLATGTLTLLESHAWYSVSEKRQRSRWQEPAYQTLEYPFPSCCAAGLDFPCVIFGDLFELELV